MKANTRIAILGAGSLRGKQLNETLAESTLAAAEVLLMDDQDALGQLESVGDEVTFIQPITPQSFERVDYAFFAGHPDLTRRYWQNAVRSGASVVDLSYALESEKDVPVRGPWIRDRSDSNAAVEPPALAEIGLHTAATVSAHPAALVLALLAARAQSAGPVRRLSATILEPASEYGRGAMDELHRQTVALLSFQSIPKDLYGIQLAFNALAAAGEESKIPFAESQARILRHYRLLSAGRLPQLALQLIHAPVFHGHTFSIAVEYEKAVAFEHLQASLSGPRVEWMQDDADAPSNLNAAGREEILLRMRLDDAGQARSDLVWLWAASDNLKVSASNAVECALDLGKLRPQGEIQ